MANPLSTSKIATKAIAQRAEAANCHAMTENFADRIRAAMKARGITNEEIAARMGAHTVTVSKLLNGKMKINESWLLRFATALDMPVDLMLNWDSPRHVIQKRPGTTGVMDDVFLPDFTAAGRRTLPVYGLAAASVKGNFTMTNDPIEWVACPAALDRVRDAYALVVTGSSMEPRYFAGDVIFVHPNRPPRPGDHVVIQEALDGGLSVSVKRFDRQDEQHLFATQYNPLSEIRFLRAHITAVHRILTTNEIAGV